LTNATNRTAELKEAVIGWRRYKVGGHDGGASQPTKSITQPYIEVGFSGANDNSANVDNRSGGKGKQRVLLDSMAGNVHCMLSAEAVIISV
jgi:hypothetical protein